jgi:hypothetical protein
VQDASAFKLLLASVCAKYEQTKIPGPQGQPTAESLQATTYYWAAVGEVKKRLLDPKDGISEGVIGTVLGFACLDVSTNSLASSSESNRRK